MTYRRLDILFAGVCDSNTFVEPLRSGVLSTRTEFTDTNMGGAGGKGEADRGQVEGMTRGI